MPQTARVYTTLQSLIDGAKANEVSLAVFNLAKITGFVWEAAERNWDPAKVEGIRNHTNQGGFFVEETWRQFHFVAPNPGVIIGVFPTPHELQADLF